MNPFSEGQKVVCISDHFPHLPQYGGTPENTADKPKKGEILVIDEILGDFLRFDKYDTEQSFNWWMHNRFAPLTDESEQLNEGKHLLQWLNLSAII